MKKRIFSILCISFSLIASTLSMSATAADEYPWDLWEIGDLSCAAPKKCSAISNVVEENEMAIVAWTGDGNAWTNGVEIDFTADRVNSKILADNDIRDISTVALYCISVGNCEGLVIGIGDNEQKIRKTGILNIATHDTIKPYKTIYFLVSQVDSIWQTPKHIETLSFTQQHQIMGMVFHAAIYCVSHGNCVIAGNSGGVTEALIKSTGNVYGENMLNNNAFFLSQTEGVWSAPQFPMVKKLQNRGSQFYTIKCSSLADCVIHGGYVPSTTLDLKLKTQNKIAPKYKSVVLSLGITINLVNGKLGEPKTNLGPSYKKGPFPKGDPKVYLRDDPYENNWNPRANMMSCIKSENCRMGPITPSVGAS